MPLFERGGKLVVNNSGSPIECTTCPCGGGQSCCFGASVPNNLTLTMPNTVANSGGCVNCSTAMNNRSFVLSYTTTTTGGQCQYDGTYTGTGISCFGIGDDTIYAQILVNATSPGSTNCTVSASVAMSGLYRADYTATFGNSVARPWSVPYSANSFCNLSTAGNVTVN